ncbi:MAG: hypothetical protein ACD_7C00173G0003 [uncultured bacterium]|nr:MAG: hypothetical protein ACD_7C00173G0003 [uncultured bacterium]
MGNYSLPNAKWECKLSFRTLISRYIKIQSSVVAQVRSLSSGACHATPGRFLMVQFAMSQVTQIGESISNMIYQINTMLGAAVRNQKGQ